METLDGKNVAEFNYRPCVVEENYTFGFEVDKIKNTVVRSWKGTKALFHHWNPITGNAIVEYADGTVHEVEPWNIRFVGNTMSEYVFPETEG